MNSLVTDQIRENAEISEINDHFGYHNLAKHLLDYILEKNKKCSISVGIYGKWGSGKTVLANFLKKESSKKKKIKIIEIDAMEFKGADENIFEYFLYKIAEKILGDEFKKFLKKPKENWWNKLCRIIKGVNIEVFGIGISLNDILERVLIKEEELSNLVEKIKKKKAKGIVLIDNLDRLQPKETIIFLEKLKAFFLSDGKKQLDNFAYVLMCDFDILEKEVKDIYGETINVRDYLNKLIELPFYLPSPKKGNIQSFIKSLLNPKIPDVMMEKICAILEMARIETPRDIKIFLMELDMTFVIAKARGTEEEFLIKNLNRILAFIFLKSLDVRIFDFLKKEKRIDIKKGDFIRKFHNHIFDLQWGDQKILSEGGSRTKNVIKICDFVFQCFPKLKFSNPANQQHIEFELFSKILEIVDSASQKHTEGREENIVVEDSVKIVKNP